MKENIGVLQIENKVNCFCRNWMQYLPTILSTYFLKGVLQVVDIPGHERVRQKYFDLYKGTARGIVFVVDSLTLSKDIRDVAEYD